MLERGSSPYCSSDPGRQPTRISQRPFDYKENSLTLHCLIRDFHTLSNISTSPFSILNRHVPIMSISSAEVAADFKDALQDLKVNSRPEISNLTIIAKENTEHAQAISRELENHIRTVGIFLSRITCSSFLTPVLPLPHQCSRGISENETNLFADTPRVEVACPLCT